MKKIKAKRDAYGRWLQTREAKDYSEYAKLRNQVKSQCRKSDRDYEMKIAKDSKKNPKIFYSFTKKKLKVREGIGDLKDNEETISSNEGKAECLNRFFCSVFTEENLESIPSFSRNDVYESIECVQFTRETVLKKLRNLNTSKSAGPDNIQTVVLKELAEELAEPIAYLFNASMKEGKLPYIWKDANVTPLFKKGPKNQPSNYRPVSLTCVLCKLMESIIRDNLVDYLQRNNLLSNVQHGFIAQRSCTTNLLATLDAWTQSLDEGNPVDVIYLDFAKAFDSVPHRRLLEKLKAYGITSKLLDWISDFLIGRRQRVCVNGSHSDWSQVVSGVPQGSCLGPVLFIIYINDLPDVVKSLTQMYADDTKVYSESNNVELQEQLQNDIENLVNWADTWQLRFNADKCHSVHLGHNNERTKYNMRRHGCEEKIVLLQSQVEKDLGVQVDDELKFSTHIIAQTNKANRLVGLIRRSFTYLDKELMKQLFISLVRPVLEFANVVWMPRFQKDIDLLENVQKRATKLVPGMKDKNYNERLKLMKLPSLKFRRNRGDLIEVYKYTHDFYNVNNSMFELDKNNRTRGHNLKLVKPRCRLGVRQNFFSNRIIDKWNNLPAEIVNSPTLNSFKSRLDHHLASEMYIA